MKNKKIALFIDAENVNHHHVDPLIKRLSNYGVVGQKIAYGNWADNLSCWKETVMLNGINTIQQFNLTKKKNSSDIALVIGVMDFIQNPSNADVDTICIMSSDSDFTPIIIRLRQSRYSVIIAAQHARVSSLLSSVSDSFIDTTSLIKQPVQPTKTTITSTRENYQKWDDCTKALNLSALPLSAHEKRYQSIIGQMIPMTLLDFEINKNEKLTFDDLIATFIKPTLRTTSLLSSSVRRLTLFVLLDYKRYSIVNDGSITATNLPLPLISIHQQHIKKTFASWLSRYDTLTRSISCHLKDQPRVKLNSFIPAVLYQIITKSQQKRIQQDDPTLLLTALALIEMNPGLFQLTLAKDGEFIITAL